MKKTINIKESELIELMANIARDVLKEQAFSHMGQREYDHYPFPNGKVRRLTQYGVTPIAIEVDNGAVIEDYESYFKDWVKSGKWEEINSVECKFPYSKDFKGIHQYMYKRLGMWNGIDTEWGNFEGDDINTPGGGNRNKHDMAGAPNHSEWNWVSACKYAKLLIDPGHYRNKDGRMIGPGDCCEGQGKYRNDWAGISKIFAAYNRQGVPSQLLELENTLGTGMVAGSTQKTKAKNDKYKKDVKDLPSIVKNMLALRFIDVIALQCKWRTLQKYIPLPLAPDEDEIEDYMRKYPNPVDSYGAEITGGEKNGALGYSKALKPGPVEVADYGMTLNIPYPEALQKDILPEWLKFKFSELPDPTIWMGTFDWLVPLLSAVPIEKMEELFTDFMEAMEKAAKAVYPYYHYVIDAISFIAYILCPFTGGVGCAISVAADVLNAYLYVVDDNDYYMAGMQMAFAIVPGGEFIKYSSVWLKPYLMPVFRAGVFKMPAKAVKKTALSSLKWMTTAQKEAAKKIFTKDALKTMKTMLKSMNVVIKPYFKTVKWLKHMWESCNAMCRALIIFMELLWYDPALPAQLLELVSEEGSVIRSLSDWMKTWPKPLLSVWSSRLASAGKFKAAITTTPYDCTGNMFVWFQKDMKSDGDASVEQSWLSDGFEEEDFNEENVWAEWQKGWRPKDLVSDLVYYYNAEIKVNTELMKEYDIYLKDCITYIQYMKSKDEGDVKMMYLIFTELGWTEAELDDLRHNLSGEKEKKKLDGKIIDTPTWGGE